MKAKVERLGRFGDGIAAGPIHVPGGLPGEVCEGGITGDRMESPKILEPSPQRVRPPCAHFKRCGGCVLQHANDEFVADWKRQQVLDALAANGLPKRIAHLHTSPSQSRLRASLKGRRTRSGAIVGFHERRSEAIVDIERCKLLHPDLLATLPALRELVRVGASRSTAVGLTVSLTSNGVDVLVTDGKQLDLALREALAGICQQADLARLTWGDETVAMQRPPVVWHGKAPVVLPPGAFQQATADGAAVLVEAARGALDGLNGPIVDLFAGCGTFTLPMAERHEMHAFDSDPALISALDAGWRKAHGLKRVTATRRNLFRNPLGADELNGHAAAIIDPPRAGAREQMKALAKSSVDHVFSVSCNPHSFARDARILVDAGFSMGAVLVVDQFRWSTHVELACLFSRR